MDATPEEEDLGPWFDPESCTYSCGGDVKDMEWSTEQQGYICTQCNRIQ